MWQMNYNIELIDLVRSRNLFIHYSEKETQKKSEREREREREMTNFILRVAREDNEIR